MLPHQNLMRDAGGKRKRAPPAHDPMLTWMALLAFPGLSMMFAILTPMETIWDFYTSVRESAPPSVQFASLQCYYYFSAPTTDAAARLPDFFCPIRLAVVFALVSIEEQPGPVRRRLYTLFFINVPLRLTLTSITRRSHPSACFCPCPHVSSNKAQYQMPDGASVPGAKTTSVWVCCNACAGVALWLVW